MLNRMRNKLIAFLRDAALRRRSRRVLFVLAAITVFWTTYALILPAITLDSKGGNVRNLNEALVDVQDEQNPPTVVTNDSSAQTEPNAAAGETEESATKASSEPSATETSSEQNPAEASSEQSAAETSSEQNPAEVSSEPSAAETSSEQNSTEVSSEQSATEISSEQNPAEASSEQNPIEASSEQSATSPLPLKTPAVQGSSQVYEIKNGEVAASSLTLTLKDPDYLKQEKKYLTGEETTLRFDVDNAGSGLTNNLFRVYFDFDQAGEVFNNGVTTITFSGNGTSSQDLTVHRVQRSDGSSLYYMDIDSVSAGATLSGQLTLSYPNRTEIDPAHPNQTKAGGNIKVWAEVLSKSPSPSVPSESYKKPATVASLDADFVTVRRESDIQKSTSKENGTVIKTGPTQYRLSGAGFSYRGIAQPRGDQSETLPDNMGTNPVKELVYEDTITLDNAKFAPELLKILSDQYSKLDTTYGDNPLPAGKSIAIARDPYNDTYRVIYYRDSAGVHELAVFYSGYNNLAWNNVFVKKNTENSITIKLSFTKDDIKALQTWESSYDPKVGVPFDRVLGGFSLRDGCVINDESTKKMTIQNQVRESVAYTFEEEDLTGSTEKDNPRDTTGTASKDATWDDATYDLLKMRSEWKYEPHIFGKEVPHDLFLTIHGIGTVEGIQKLEDPFNVDYYFTPKQIADLFTTVGAAGPIDPRLLDSSAYQRDLNDYLTLHIAGATFVEKNGQMLAKGPLTDIHGNAVSDFDVQYFDDDSRHDNDYGQPGHPINSNPKTGEITFKKLAADRLEAIIKIGTTSRREEIACTPDAIRSFLANTWQEPSTGKTWSFMVTNGTQYTLTYDFTGKSAPQGKTLADQSTWAAGQSWGKRVNATLKDSFMRLTMDLQGKYHDLANQSNVFVAPNQVNLTTKKGTETIKSLNGILSEDYGFTAQVEFMIGKKGQAEADGRIHYQIDITNTMSNTAPQALPLTDFLPNPARVLLDQSAIDALKAAQKLTDADVQTIRMGGVDYGWISKPGTYPVIIDGRHVNLTIQEEGSLLRWIGKNDDWGDVQAPATFDYWVALAGSQPVEGNTFFNHAYLGDQEGHRLTASHGLGIKLNSGKEIVLQKDPNGDPNKDKIDADGFTLLRRGDTVTYRIPLQSISSWNLHRDRIWDRLPQGVTWTRDNVHVSTLVESHYANTISFAPGVENSWQITNIDPKTKLSTPDQQYLVWTGAQGTNDGDDFATFGSTGMAYVYITLDYPTDEAAWTSFLNQGEVKNTAVVEDADHYVLHDKETPITGILEKDVVGSRTWPLGAGKAGGEFSSHNNVFGPLKKAPEQELRDVLSNDSYRNSSMLTQPYVAYQVLIANRGTRRLFLDDVMDTLPPGFTYEALLDASTNQGDFWGKDMREADTIVTTDRLEDYDLPEAVSLSGSTTPLIKRNVQVEALDGKTGQAPKHNGADDLGHVRFRLTVGDNSRNGFERDEERYGKDEGRSFLNPGEYVLFYYYARTNRYQDTPDVATNTIGMKVLDEGNLKPEQTNDVLTHTREEGGTTVPFTTVNQGDRKSVAETDAEHSKTGWTSDVEGHYWWQSNVTVKREEKIGFTKTVQPTAIVQQNAPVTWLLSPEPKGAESVLSDPTIVDALPRAYSLQEIHIQNKIPWSPQWQREVPKSFKLKVTKIDDQTRKVDLLNDSQTSVDQTCTITANATLQLNNKPEITMHPSYYANDLKLHIAFRINSEGGEEWKFQLCGQDYSEVDAPTLALVAGPAHGRTAPDGKHINNAWLYPNQDFPLWKFSNTGTYTTDELQVMDGHPAVKDAAEVLVLGPYATDSTKRLTRIPAGATAPFETVTSGQNLLVLSPTDDSLQYTLEVNNANSDKHIDKLVVIDTLPRVGDTEVFDASTGRGSDFPIFFDPSKLDVTVNIVDKSGNVTPVPSSAYRVDYKDSAQITAADKNGETTGGEWKAAPNDALDPTTATRTIRVTLGTKYSATSSLDIPPESKVQISFYARLDPNQKRGDVVQTAWNSFGYTYTMKEQAAGSNPLSASPEKVGARLPENPKITKKIIRAVDGVQGPLEDKLKTTQRYVYLLVEDDPQTAPGWNLADLEQSDIVTQLSSEQKHLFFGLDVPAGESEKTVSLNDPVFNGFFQPGKAYSLYEVTTGTADGEQAALFDTANPAADSKGFSTGTFTPLANANQLYQGKKFAYADFYDKTYGAPAVHSDTSPKLTFTYDANAETTHFVYQNRTESWSIAVIKQEAGAPVKNETTTLADNSSAVITNYPRYLDGPVFALYSPSAADQMGDDAYTEATNLYTITALPRTITGWDGNRTFYLAKVEQANTAAGGQKVYHDANGNTMMLPSSLSFDSLDQDCYVVKEISAIDGYSNQLPNGVLLYRKEPTGAHPGENGEASPNIVGAPSMIQQATPGTALSAWPKLVDEQGTSLSGKTTLTDDSAANDKVGWYLVGNARSNTKVLPGLGGKGRETFYLPAIGVILAALAYIGYVKWRKGGDNPMRDGG